MTPKTINNNWRLLRREEIGERHMRAFLYEHKKMGSQFLYLDAPDDNKAFSVSFRTLPEDNTGAPHILEHCVLTGSEKYPIRDPFFSMLKRSLQSFMNAFTAEDWTAYPFASPNDKDFFNLLDVYLDAVFFPRLSIDNFRQEGHRLEMEGGKLVRKGVVYNEMKGSLSSPERKMTEEIKRRLFPCSAYRFNSGGDPAAIPRLTHAGLRDYHRRHYHPGNARFYAYGRLPVERVLDMIDRQLMSRFSPARPQAPASIEPAWQRPRSTISRYQYGGPDRKRRCQYSLTWLIGRTDDRAQMLAWEMIDDLLLGHPGARLRARLLESGLGSDLSDAAGLMTDMRQAWFSAGLKDVRQEDKGRIGKIIISELKDIARNGFSPEEALASLRRQEMDAREISNQPYPHGLDLWLELVGPWQNGADPVTYLRFKDLFDKMADKIKKGYLEKLIKKQLIDNKHLLKFLLIPDPGLSARQEKSERQGLDRLQRRLPPVRRRELESGARRLAELQNGVENLDCLPALDLSDIDPRIKKLSPGPGCVRGIFRYRQPTNGLFYAAWTCALGRAAPSEPLWPFWAYLLTRIGTQNKDYRELARAIQTHSGGIEAGVFSRSMAGRSGIGLGLLLNGKGLPDQISGLLELMAEIRQDSRFVDQGVFQRFLKEYIAGLEQSITGNGHVFAMSAAAAGLSPAARISEDWTGLSQLLFLRQTAGQDPGMILEKMTQMARYSSDRPGSVALIGEAGELRAAGPFLDRFFPKRSSLFSGLSLPRTPTRTQRAFAADTDVAFTARALAVPRIGHKDAPALLVLAKVLGRGFIHNEIREKGGAYGGYARYDHIEGIWYYASYRDPQPVRSFQIYDQARDFVVRQVFGADEVKDAVIAVIGDIERPMSPAESARQDFFRRLIGLDDKTRLEFKKGLLQLGPEEIRSAARRHLATEHVGEAVIIDRSKVGEFKDFEQVNI